MASVTRTARLLRALAANAPCHIGPIARDAALSRPEAASALRHLRLLGFADWRDTNGDGRIWHTTPAGLAWTQPSRPRTIPTARQPLALLASRLSGRLVRHDVADYLGTTTLRVNNLTCDPKDLRPHRLHRETTPAVNPIRTAPPGTCPCGAHLSIYRGLKNRNDLAAGFETVCAPCARSLELYVVVCPDESGDTTEDTRRRQVYDAVVG